MVISVNTYFNNSQSITNSISDTSRQLMNNFHRISSGSLRAQDNPANIALVAEYATQIASANAVARNISDGVSLSNTADNALSNIHSSVGRARALAVQAANETLSDEDRNAIVDEYNKIFSSVNDSIENTRYNGVGVLNGGASNLHIEAGVSSSSPLAVNIRDMSGILDGIDLSSADAANASIDEIDSALESIASEMANVGAMSNRFTSAANSVAVTYENLNASKSTINDIDIAIEVALSTKNKLLLMAQIKSLSETFLVNKSTFDIEV